MTGAQVDAIQMLFPNAANKTFLLHEFEEAGATSWRDVPDPIGLGRDVYNSCAETIKNALPSVLAFVEESEVVVRSGGRSGGASTYLMSDLPHSTEPSLGAPSGGLRKVDPEIYDAVAAEEKRQRENIELIASENFTSRAVMEAQGSVLTNKYAEGYPAKRWYGGCENVDTVEKLANETKPAMITAGASAYPRTLDFPRLRHIADACGALLFIDMAHVAGLVAGGQHPSPIPHAQFVTTTTHKSLRGPRGGIVLCREKYAKQIDSMVFPGIQGGPLMHVIAAKAVCFHEALQPQFREYQK